MVDAGTPRERIVVVLAPPSDDPRTVAHRAGKVESVDASVARRVTADLAATLDGIDALEWDLDAVLVGLLILEHPLAAEVTDEWCATPRWREAASILLRHRRRGGQLGDLIVAGEVLRRAHCDLMLCDVGPEPEADHASHSGFDLPWTTAGDAVCAVADCASPTVALAEARKRLPILQLCRLVRLFGTLTAASLEGVFAAFPAVRAAMTEIEANVARFHPDLPRSDCPQHDRTDAHAPAPRARVEAVPMDEDAVIARALGVEVLR